MMDGDVWQLAWKAAQNIELVVLSDTVETPQESLDEQGFTNLLTRREIVVTDRPKGNGPSVLPFTHLPIRPGFVRVGMRAKVNKDGTRLSLEYTDRETVRPTQGNPPNP